MLVFQYNPVIQHFVMVPSKLVEYVSFSEASNESILLHGFF